MAGVKTVNLYFPSPMDERARSGRHNFVNHLSTALDQSGWQLEIRRAGPADTLAAQTTNEHALFLMQEPFHDRGLSLRMSYLKPFWRIERTSRRWDFDVARKIFDPQLINRRKAARFANYWGERLFGSTFADVYHDGIIYVPLQGHISRRRSFQSMSPLAMLDETVKRVSIAE